MFCLFFIKVFVYNREGESNPGPLLWANQFRKSKYANELSLA